MTECIPWSGRLDRDGYGRSRDKLAHRVAWEAEVGPIPAGLTIDHLCRNRACVNVAHLEPVTRGENIRRAGPATKTHCHAGHEFTPENTYPLRWGNGRRQCRACNRAAVARSRERKAS